MFGFDSSEAESCVFDEYEDLQFAIALQLDYKEEIDAINEPEVVKEFTKKLMLEVLHTDRSEYSQCRQDIFGYYIYLASEELQFDEYFDLYSLSTALLAVLKLKNKEE